MPVVFLGHGSPMNTLDDNRYTRAWQRVGAAVKPRAILVISAHWFVGVTAVTAMQRPRTIHDFFGFPTRLATFQYPAAGAPDLAAEVADLVKPMWVGLDDDSWGLDHGAWSVLAHAFPAADVPVVQLSLNVNKDLDYHLALATRLAPLRDRGVLILASGNVVHNLGRMDPRRPDHGFDWAQRYEEASRELFTRRPGNVAELLAHPDHAAAVPTPDHWLPMAYVAALAHQAGRPLDVVVDGYAFGSLSMTSYALDLACPPAGDAGEQAAVLPDPDIPPDQTNI